MNMFKTISKSARHVIADDFGWTDLAGYGSKLYESPHIDQLARDGMKFTQNYSACTVCLPTRSALLKLWWSPGSTCDFVYSK